MRIANLRGRLTVLTDSGGVDVETASNGRFAADPQAVFTKWAAFRAWAAGVHGPPTVPVAEAELGAAGAAPTQVFGIGLNYRDHAAESGLPVPDRPATFTKFPPCIARAVRRRGAAQRRRSTGRSSWSWSSARARTGSRKARLATRRRPHGRPGSLGARRAVGGGRAVLARQVLPRLRPDGPLAGHARRARRPATTSRSAAASTATMVQKSRTSDMVFGVPRLDRRAVGHSAAAARRRDLHRHAGRHRRDAQAAALPAAGRRADAAGSRASAACATAASRAR